MGKKEIPYFHRGQWLYTFGSPDSPKSKKPGIITIIVAAVFLAAGIALFILCGLIEALIGFGIFSLLIFLGGVGLLREQKEVYAKKKKGGRKK